MKRPRHIAAPLSLALGAALGCTTTQEIALDCVPRDMTVFVDGRRLEEVPDKLKLRADEPHTLFFKGAPYPAELVVLESREVDGVFQLSPEQFCTETRFAPTAPAVEMELDPD